MGDAVLYGTGPQSVYSSVHVGIVTQVWPDGSIMTVGGDSGPGRDGYLSVALDGPFLPADSELRTTACRSTPSPSLRSARSGGSP